jgi:type II secretory pathway component PulL
MMTPARGSTIMKESLTRKHPMESFSKDEINLKFELVEKDRKILLQEILSGIEKIQLENQWTKWVSMTLMTGIFLSLLGLMLTQIFANQPAK